MKPKYLSLLLIIFFISHYKHAIGILKILQNLVKIGIKNSIFEEVITEIQTNSCLNELSDLQTQINSPKSKILNILFQVLVINKESKWNSEKFLSSGSHCITIHILELIKQMTRSQVESIWKEETDFILDNFFSKTSSYSQYDTEVCLSLLGAENLTFEYGATGRNKHNNKIKVVGFCDQWYKLQIPNTNNECGKSSGINPSNTMKNRKSNLLVIEYDEQDQSKYHFRFESMDDVKFDTFGEVSNSYLCKEGKFTEFLNIFNFTQSLEESKESIDIPQEDHIKSLLKKSLCLETLMYQLNHNGINSLHLSTSSLLSILKICLKECSSSTTLSLLPHSALIAKIQNLLTLSSETKTQIFSNNIPFTLHFYNKTIVLNKNSQDAIHTHHFEVQSALNYGLVAQKQPFNIVSTQLYF
jgi:hypothetical protein